MKINKFLCNRVVNSSVLWPELFVNWNVSKIFEEQSRTVGTPPDPGSHGHDRGQRRHPGHLRPPTWSPR